MKKHGHNYLHGEKSKEKKPILKLNHPPQDPARWCCGNLEPSV